MIAPMSEVPEYETIAQRQSEASMLQKASWVLYDWANSGYGLVVIGPVFPAFFIKALLPLLPGKTDDHGLIIGSLILPGSAVMGILTSISMALMAIGAPILGAVADIKGWTKRLLIIFGVTGSILAMAMYFLQPGQWMLGALLYTTSNFCFGSSFAFYNAFLPRLTRPEKQGSLSGWGFAMGYIGGAVALIVALQIIQIDLNNPRYVSIGLAVSGLWWLIFSLPAFIYLREFPPVATGERSGSLLLEGFRRIAHTFRNIRHYRMLFLFLLAFLLYNDGVETVISMSSSFGTDYLKMTQEELIKMFLIVQFVAFGGALVFGYLADRIGNKQVIVINLAVWVATAILAMFVKSPGQFTMLGVLVGVVLGGVQASSRALMGQLAPREIHNEAFGFFAISGKFASIFGPLLYAGLATAWGPRYGIVSVFPFLVAGLVVLLFVKEPRPEPPGFSIQNS
jgi:MFS transporter, UMF1 family